MKHSELSNFTHSELSNFTYAELELDVNELFSKMRHDNRQLPLSIIEKLQKLCEDLPEDIPKPKRQLSISEGAVIISGIINYLDKLPDISKKLSPMFQSIIEDIAQLFKL